MAIVLGLALVIAGGSVAVFAQGGTLQYGDVVDGEITNEAFEIEYSFTGSANDLVIVRMWTEGFENVLTLPALALATSDNQVLGTTADHTSIMDATLVATLPADGDYKILATRLDGSAGQTVGTFKLSVFKPEVLTPGQSVTGSISSEDTAFYLVEAEGPFVLAYQRTGGTFSPEVSVNAVSDIGEAESRGLLGGTFVRAGSLEIDPGGSGQFIVTLQEALWDFNFEPISAEYSLTLNAAE
jgi:hypothetical protein